ncbi:17230_t:CDS:2 [Funneliformis geosporum]|uniref:5334_t:CDS:1 n=1 Tax=Funneliformis geosporum TaxID=1117311 RepID=A0A9W4WZL5_9GLOM|nr:5334_t:CDS:2 [Funneliformis geosporum]CAI2188588.1 17230_t:CDS:2 [Funneliformis geosporum]
MQIIINNEIQTVEPNNVVLYEAGKLLKTSINCGRCTLQDNGNEISWNKSARALLLLHKEKFHKLLEKTLPESQMPFEDTVFESETRKLVVRIKFEFFKQISDAGFPGDLADNVIKKFNDVIQSDAAELKAANALNLNSTNENYSKACEQLESEYVVKLHSKLRGEPKHLDKILTKCCVDILDKYDKKTSKFPFFITNDCRSVFQYRLLSRDREFATEYRAYMKQYMDDFRKVVDVIFDQILSDYELQVNTKLPTFPMSETELEFLLKSEKKIATSDFDLKTKTIPGRQRAASKAYIKHRRKSLVDSIKMDQENMSIFNMDASEYFSTRLWDEKIQPIRDRVKNGDYVEITEFQEEFSTFKNSYNLAARGPASSIVWDRRKKETDSWEENIVALISARPFDGKNIEFIYNNIMNSTLTLIDQLAADLGWGWAGNGQYRRAATGYKWICTMKTDGFWSDRLPSFMLYDFAHGFKNLVPSDPIIEYINPRQINTRIYGPYPEDNTITRKVDYTVTEQLTWESSTKFSFDQEISDSYKQGIKEMWETSIGLRFGFSQELFNKHGRTKTITRTESSTSEIFIPAGKRIQITSIVSDQSITVNYIATLIVTASLRIKGFLRLGSEEGPDANYHSEFRGKRSEKYWQYDFGDMTEIYDQMVQNRAPWLWNECQQDHPRISSVLEQLKDPKKYEYIVSGKFHGINGVRVEEKSTVLR